MLRHKKFQGALVASLAIIFGGILPAFTGDVTFLDALIAINWNMVIAPWLVAIGGQSIADIGKEKAIIENGYRNKL